MAYELFLFDLDDTLLNFRESERLSFFRTLQHLGVTERLDELFSLYQKENMALWMLFEQGKTTKEHLKTERFRRIFAAHQIALDPEATGIHYLETLPKTVVLIDHAVEICEWLSQRGEIGIITNGIQSVQARRIQNSKLAPYISFVSVSEACGFAKPDARFFEHSAKMAKRFSKPASLMIGDRLDTDILGAHHFGVDSCWFNPNALPLEGAYSPKHQIGHLSEIKGIVAP